MKTKAKKKFWLQAVFLGAGLITLTGAGTVHAAGYWTVSNYTVSPHGQWSSWGLTNTKQTNANVASFNGDVLPNWFGYDVRLINSDGYGRSDFTDLKKDQTTYGYNNKGLRGYKYSADPRSKSYEDNYSTIKLHFSSDRK